MLPGLIRSQRWGDSRRRSALRQSGGPGLSEENVLHESERAVNEESCGRRKSKEFAEEHAAKSIQVNVTLATMNASDAAEEFGFGYGKIFRVERVAFGDQERSGFASTSLGETPENAVNEKTLVAFIEDYLTGGSGLERGAPDEHVISGADPGKHAGTKNAKTCRTVGAQFCGDWIDARVRWMRRELLRFNPGWHGCGGSGHQGLSATICDVI